MKKVDPRDYLWIIVESTSETESFFGIELPHHGHVTLATRTREEAEELLRRLPPPPAGTTRQVEAIHRAQLASEATKHQWGVRIVDGRGRILGEP